TSPPDLFPRRASSHLRAGAHACVRVARPRRAGGGLAFAWMDCAQCLTKYKRQYCHDDMYVIMKTCRHRPKQRRHFLDEQGPDVPARLPLHVLNGDPPVRGFTAVLRQPESYPERQLPADVQTPRRTPA